MPERISQPLMRSMAVLFMALILGLSGQPDRAQAAGSSPLSSGPGFIVDPLPEGNLVANPWFRKFVGDKGSQEGWVDETGIWGLSNKLTNPAPDTEYGTAARFAHNSGFGGAHGGVEASIYTLIATSPEHTLLKFKTHWVSGWIIRAGVAIYGSESEAGPWTLVWEPLAVTPQNSSHFDWTETELLTHSLNRGYSFYKIEYSALYPESRSAGFKFTGVYFSTEPGGPGDGLPREVFPEGKDLLPTGPFRLI